MASKKPTAYEVAGKNLKCLVCGHDQFRRREGQLNTQLASFLNLDWTDKSAECVICDHCGHIHWFLPR
jgi:hypothetical protein